MRIALVCHYLPPHEGGIERVVGRLADGYRDRGHHPVIIGWGDDAAAARATSHRVLALPGANPLERFGVPVPILDPLRASWRLRRELSGADALHVHGLPYLGSMLALLHAGRLGLPTIVTEHVGAIPYDRAALRVAQAVALGSAVRLARRSATAVTVLNERVADELRRGLQGVPVVKVANGVDTVRFSPASATRRAELRAELGFDRPTVLSVGRNVAKKGMGHVLEAARHGAFDVLLVGRDTAPLADGTRIRVIEGLTQERLADLYRAADALVLASEGEGLPLVVQEALASGLPVVMSDDPAVRAELPEAAVWFVDPTDPRAMAAAIDDAVHQRARLAPLARAEAVERFDWDRAVVTYERLLRTGPATLRERVA